MIEKHNFHWREGFFYGFPKKRELFDKLVPELKTRQIISLTGLRRTGKSTLLKQLMDHLIGHEKVSRESVLSFSFDEEQPKLEEIMKEYEAKTGRDLLNEKATLYLFLDEVQKLENWQNQVKYYYDNYPNMKFFVSGSSSLFIRKHVRESLAGRIYEFVLPPLSFGEFLVFRGKEDLLIKPDMFSDTLKREFSAYQKRQFIEIINESEEKAGQYVRTMLEKIIYQDIPKVFPIENAELLMRIMKIVASNPGMLSDYASLSNELGISRVTLSNYFFYLEESFLIKKMYNFSKNLLTSEKRMKKFYLASTSFFAFLNNDIEETKLLENLVTISLDAVFFWRTPQKYEVDIVLKKGGKFMPIEVKYSNDISTKDMKNLLRFSETFGVTNALVITKYFSESREFGLSKGGRLRVDFVPAWSFLMNPKKGI